MRRTIALLVLGLSTAAAGFAAGADDVPDLEVTSCTTCHGDAEMFDEDHLAITGGFLADVHGSVGLSCHNCHGGNPDPALADDMEAAMDPGYGPNPYRGAPERTEVPSFCGSCHSDPEFMKQYSPDPRVDQEREYGTSHHGRALASGDARVATCIDCHGTHGIRRVGDPEAAVFPTRVAEMCGGCHSDPERMAGTLLPNGRQIPVDQHARWTQSVHARAMFELGDLTAPTCNDCHGNHGASPPGVQSVAFVCGQCHGREAELFRASPKRDGFETHNEYLLEAEGEACLACHEPPEPQAAVKTVHSFGECASCHGNHGVVRPTMAMLGAIPDTPCALCHESTDAGEAVLDEPRILENYREKRDQLLADAEAAGLTGDERFDWLVDQALALGNHTVVGSGEEGHVVQLRPQFARLFQKFRIGKTHFTFIDPVTSQERREPVMTCDRCHAEESGLAEDPVGLSTSREFVTRMRELMHTTAVAERTLLTAERGGVQVHEALTELDQAINAQIELEVLVHTFSLEDDPRFEEKHAEGMEHAQGALTAGRASLGELSNRRKGLGVALVFIVLTAVGLTVRIRQLGD